MTLQIAPGAVLGTPADRIGSRVFKRWAWNSDGIGTTMLDFARSRPDLMGGAVPALERYSLEDTANPENPQSVPRLRYGSAADAVFRRFHVERRGVDGMRDGRTDVVFETGSGRIHYSGRPYGYDPASVLVRDAATFIGGAVAGFFAVTAAAGAVAGASTHAAASGSIDAAFADLATATGTLAPEGVGSLIPAGATLGGPGVLTGGALTLGAATAPSVSAVGAAASNASTVDKAVAALQSSAIKAADKLLVGKLVQLIAGDAESTYAAEREAAPRAVASSPQSQTLWIAAAAALALVAVAL